MNAMFSSMIAICSAVRPRGYSTISSIRSGMHVIVEPCRIPASSLSRAPHNTQPLAQSDFYSVTRGGTITTPAPGVLINDNRRPASRAVLVSPPAHGTLTLLADGSFTYQNDGSAATFDSFAYQVTDGHIESNVA